MRGHIRKRGSKYSVVVDIGIDPSTGKRKQKWFSGYNSEKEAEIAMAKIITQIHEGTLLLPSDMMLKDYLTMWIEKRKKRLSPSSVSGYLTIINKHLIPSLGFLKLKDIKPYIIDEYYDTKLETLSGTTVLHHHRMLNKAMVDAIKKYRLISVNPLDGVEAPKANKYKAEVLNQEEIQLLFQALQGHQLEIPIQVMLFLGLRRGELLALKWEDIDYENKTITIQRNLIRGGDSGTEVVLTTPKTEGSNRTIVLSDNIIKILNNHRLNQDELKSKQGKIYKDKGFIFCNEDGSNINPASFSKRFGEFLKENNLKHIRLHDLRHTNATMMLLSKIPAKVASERLGHSNVSITLDLYSHVLDEMKKEATNKIDDILFNTK